MIYGSSWPWWAGMAFVYGAHNCQAVIAFRSIWIPGPSLVWRLRAPEKQVSRILCKDCQRKKFCAACVSRALHNFEFFSEALKCTLAMKQVLKQIIILQVPVFIGLGHLQNADAELRGKLCLRFPTYSIRKVLERLDFTALRMTPVCSLSQPMRRSMQKSCKRK